MAATETAEPGAEERNAAERQRRAIRQTSERARASEWGCRISLGGGCCHGLRLLAYWRGQNVCVCRY